MIYAIWKLSIKQLINVKFLQFESVLLIKAYNVVILLGVFCTTTHCFCSLSFLDPLFNRRERNCFTCMELFHLMVEEEMENREGKKNIYNNNIRVACMRILPLRK